MIAFGCAIKSEETWRRCALTGIRRASEPDSLVMVRRGYKCLQVPYNEMLEEACAHPDLEAVALMHEDLEIDDPNFADAVRAAFADPSVGVTGALGARGGHGLAWWEGEHTVGRVRTLQNWFVTGEHGKTDWMVSGREGVGGDVDSVDGMLIVVSAAAARAVRFDEAMCALFHGYDVDYCKRARDQGFRVTTSPLKASHWARLDLPDRARWIEANVAYRRRQSPRLAWASALRPRPPSDRR